jgi:hypothetical protein
MDAFNLPSRKSLRRQSRRVLLIKSIVFSLDKPLHR